MKPSIVIVVILCASIVSADSEDPFNPEYKTGISFHYGQSMIKGFYGNPLIIVSEEAMIDPLVFDLSFLATGDRGILRGNPGVGLGGVQVGCRGKLIRLGFLSVSAGIAGGGVVLKEVMEEHKRTVIGGIVTAIHEIALTLPRVRVNGKIGITKMNFKQESRIKLLQEVPNTGVGVFFTGGFVLEWGN